MGLFSSLPKDAGFKTGRPLALIFKLIAANFAKVEPSVTDSGALDYVPTLADRIILRSRATAQTLTLPTNVAVAIPIGTVLTVIQTGAGTLTIVAPAGGTVNKIAAKALTVSAQHGRVFLTKVSALVWNASGDLT